MIFNISGNAYSFDQQLIASKGVLETCDVSQILQTHIPGCMRSEQADPEADRSGVDWWAILANGERIGVDVKHRPRDCMRFGNDDVALETWSVVGKQIGWTRDSKKKCAWVMWIWADTGRFLLLPFPAVCAVFSDNWKNWVDNYKTCKQTTRPTKSRSGWESECVFVPRTVLLNAVTEWFNGAI